MSVAHADFMRVTDSLGRRAEKAEAERDEALAQVAVLVGLLEIAGPALSYAAGQGETGIILKIDRALSNLPAAAKEMVEDRVRLREALEFYADPWSKIDPDDRVPDFYSELEFGEIAQRALSPAESD